MSNPGNGGDFWEPSPEAHEAALGAATNHLQATLSELTQHWAGAEDRVKASVEELGPDLSETCRGRVCPVLSKLSLAHLSERYRVAYAMEHLDGYERRLHQRSQTEQMRQELFDTVMDQVVDGTISPQMGDSLLDFSHIDDDNDGGEVLIHEKIAVKQARIAEGTDKIKRLEEIYGGVCVTERTPRNFDGVSVIIRKALKRQPREGECFGPTDIDIGPIFAPTCTNPVARQALQTASDEGFVKLNGFEQHLVRPDTEAPNL